jgi:hypothetical protein
MAWLTLIVKSRPLGLVALVVLCIQVGILAHCARPEDFWSGFSLWILAPPFATLLLGAALPRTAQTFWFCAIAATPMLYGVFAYISLIADPTDAQAGLTFVFTPLWQLLALPFAWLIASGVGLLLNRENDA